MNLHSEILPVSLTCSSGRVCVLSCKTHQSHAASALEKLLPKRRSLHELVDQNILRSAPHMDSVSVRCFLFRTSSTRQTNSLHASYIGFHSPQSEAGNDASASTVQRARGMSIDRVRYGGWFQMSRRQTFPRSHLFVCCIYGSIISPRPCKRLRSFYPIAIPFTSWSIRIFFDLRRT